MKNEKLYYTYEIFDPVLQKKYIGSRTKGVANPYADNYWGSSRLPNWKEITQRSRKRILAVFFTKEEALQHEIELHNFFNVAANPDFFNKAKQTSTGFNTSGVTPWNVGLKMGTGPKIAERHKGRKLSNEHKAKISIAGKGRLKSEDHKRKIGESNRGKVRTEDQKNKQSEVMRGRVPWNVGKKHSPESIQKMIETKRLQKIERLKNENK